MPQINGTHVTNVNTGAVWATNQHATVFGNWVACNATPNNQPPVGFLNNPAHQFVITGNDVATAQAYNSGPLTPFPANSEPPLIFAFH